MQDSHRQDRPSHDSAGPHIETLAVHTGSRSVLVDEHAQRLVREALFLLVFGSRAPIKAALLRRLAGG